MRNVNFNPEDEEAFYAGCWYKPEGWEDGIPSKEHYKSSNRMSYEYRPSLDFNQEDMAAFKSKYAYASSSVPPPSIPTIAESRLFSTSRQSVDWAGAPAASGGPPMSTGLRILDTIKFVATSIRASLDYPDPWGGRGAAVSLGGGQLLPSGNARVGGAGVGEASSSRDDRQASSSRDGRPCPASAAASAKSKLVIGREEEEEKRRTSWQVDRKEHYH
eukprot:gene8781-33648_t